MNPGDRDYLRAHVTFIFLFLLLTRSELKFSLFVSTFQKISLPLDLGGTR